MSDVTLERPKPPLYQWSCTCRLPPLVLAVYDLRGRIRFDNPERYWQIDGRIATNCPGCGKQHLLHLPLQADVLASLPLPWQPGGT